MEALEQKINAMAASELFDVLIGLAGKTDDASDMVFTLALDALSKKATEAKFLEACEIIERAMAA